MSTRKTREEIIDYIAYQLRSGDYTKKQLDSLSEALNVIGQAGGEHTGIVVVSDPTDKSGGLGVSPKPADYPEFLLF